MRRQARLSGQRARPMARGAASQTWNCGEPTLLNTMHAASNASVPHSTVAAPSRLPRQIRAATPMKATPSSTGSTAEARAVSPPVTSWVTMAESNVTVTSASKRPASSTTAAAGDSVCNPRSLWAARKLSERRPPPRAAVTPITITLTAAAGTITSRRRRRATEKTAMIAIAGTTLIQAPIVSASVASRGRVTDQCTVSATAVTTKTSRRIRATGPSSAM